jgi:hypothetical protein
MSTSPNSAVAAVAAPDSAVDELLSSIKYLRKSEPQNIQYRRKIANDFIRNAGPEDLRAFVKGVCADLNNPELARVAHLTGEFATD